MKDDRLSGEDGFSNVTVFEHSLLEKAIGAVFVVCLLGAFVFLALERIRDSDIWGLVVFGLLGFVTIVFVVISLLRFRVTITDHFVEIRDTRCQRMYYYQVKGIRLSGDGSYLSSDSESIKILNPPFRQTQVINAIVLRIKDISGLKVEGDKKMIKKYFGDKSP